MPVNRRLQVLLARIKREKIALSFASARRGQNGAEYVSLLYIPSVADKTLAPRQLTFQRPRARRGRTSARALH